MAMGTLRTSDLLMNGGNVPLLFSADRITRLHRTLASLAKGGGSAQAESEGFFSRKNTTPPVCCAYGRRPACQRSLAIVQAFWYNGEKEDRREEEWNSGDRITGETW